MSKKNFDYKVTINFVTSAHNYKTYQTDEMIKKSVLQLLKQHLEETKKPKCLKIERNYNIAKLRRDKNGWKNKS